MLTGLIQESILAQYEAHLSGCVQCRRRLESLAGDGDDFPWTGRVSIAKSPAPPDPPVLREVMARLKSAGDTIPIVPEPDLPLLANQIRSLGGYEILTELGRGGMGVVFRARQSSLGREVALKVILSGQLASPAEVRRFQVEAEAVAKLDHPNIVPIFEIAEHEGHRFFSMKLVEGGDLERAVRAGRFRPAASQVDRRLDRAWMEAAALVATIVRAVHYAHQRGVLHRDLKPHNILLDQQDRPNVSDFGLAKLIEHDSDLTHSAAIMGSPNYMAPELASGHARGATTAADVYSLGAILYAVLTGKPPFHEATAAATLRQVLEAEPVRPRALDPSIPQDLETIALRCLEKEPARRYSSAAMIGEELDRFARGESILARRLHAPERVWRWARRKPALAALAAALPLALAIGFGGIFWQWQRADRHAAQESLQRQRAEGLAESEARQRRTAEESARRESAQRARAEFQRAELLLAKGELELPLALLARSLREEPTNSILAARIRSVLDTHGVSFLAFHPLQHNLPDKLSPIHLARFSSDGESILTVAEEGPGKVWDANTGVVRFMVGHVAAITAAEFSPVDALLAISTDRGNVRLWDSKTGLPLGAPLPHSRTFEAPLLVFSPDGRHLASGSEHVLRVWEMPSGRELRFVRMAERGPLRRLAYSGDGRFLITVAAESTTVWDEASLKLIRTLPGAKTATVAPSGDELLLDRTTLWNWREGRRRPDQILFGEHKPLAGEFSPDGRSLLLAVGELGGQLLDRATLKSRFPTLRHEEPVTKVSFSRDGGRMLTVSRGGLVGVWETRTGAPLTQPIRHREEIISAEFSPDGRRLLVLTDHGDAHVWNLRLHGVRSTRFFHTDIVTSVRFVQGGSQLLTTSRDGTAQLWGRDTGRPAFAPLRHDGGVNSAAVSPDGRLVATVGADRFLHVWSAATGMPARPGSAQTGVPRSVEFDTTGGRVVVAAEDGVARVCDAATGEVQCEVRHRAALSAAHFSSDGGQILTVSRDGTARLWNSTNGTPACGPFVHDDAVVAAAFVPDGKRIVTVSRDRMLHVWDRLAGGRIGPGFAYPAGLRIGVLQFNRAGNQVVTAAGNSAHIFDLNERRPVCPPLSHADLVLDAKLSPDGRIVATGSRDRTARLWDVTTGVAITEPLEHGGRVEHVAFSSDGRWLSSAAADGQVHLWEVPQLNTPIPDWLPDLVEALGRQQIKREDIAEAVPPKEFYRVKAIVLEADASNDFAGWAKWLLGNRYPSPLSPHSTLTIEDHVELLSSGNHVRQLRQAALLGPSNGRVHARLARMLVSDSPAKDTDALQEADWHSRYAESLSSTNTEVVAVRALVRQAMANAQTGFPGSSPATNRADGLLK